MTGQSLDGQSLDGPRLDGPRLDGQAGARLRDQLAAALPAVRAFAIPMRTRFRGITVREGALIRGPAGWGEFSPFAEYGPRECARWLACALEAAFTPWPEPVRSVAQPMPDGGRSRDSRHVEHIAFVVEMHGFGALARATLRRAVRCHARNGAFARS